MKRRRREQKTNEIRNFHNGGFLQSESVEKKCVKMSLIHFGHQNLSDFCVAEIMQILSKFYANFKQILCKFYANFMQILCKSFEKNHKKVKISSRLNHFGLNRLMNEFFVEQVRCADRRRGLQRRRDRATVRARWTVSRTKTALRGRRPKVASSATAHRD